MSDFYLPSFDDHFLNSIKEQKNQAIDAASNCRLEKTLKHVKMAGMLKQYMTHPEVTLDGANMMKDELDKMDNEVADAIRKGCRLER